MKETQVKEIVKETVQETLRGLGFNTDNPTEIQADILYLRRIRKGSEDMANIVRRTAIGLAVTGFVYGAWEVIRTAVTK